MNTRGGAYVFILIVTLLLFIAVTSALAVTERGRRAAEMYPVYSNLYDIAVSGCEQSLYRLNAALDAETIHAAARAEILTDGIVSRLTCRGGEFRLDGCYAALYEQHASALAAAFLSENYTGAPGGWRFTETLAIEYVPGAGLSAPLITDSFNLSVTIQNKTGGYIITTSASKTANGRTSYPAAVEAEFIWMPAASAHEAIFIPAYKWNEMPACFNECLNANAVLSLTPPPALPVNLLINLSSAAALAARTDEPIMIITDERAHVDLTDIYGEGAAYPFFILHTGTGALEIKNEAGDINAFTGVIISLGDILFNGVGLNGTAIAKGGLDISPASGSYPFIKNENMIFAIPFSEPARRDVFDCLGLTDFSGAAAEIEAMLGCIAFDLEGENIITVNNFDAPGLAMVKLKKIAE